MSFRLLKEYIDSRDERNGLLLSLVLLFGSPSVNQYETWNRLGKRFFEAYRRQIQACCGYDTGGLGIERIWVPLPDLFLHYMGAMERSGMMGDCPYPLLAGYLGIIFNMGNAGSTVLNKLKEQNPEYEYLFEQMKAEKKKFKIRNNSL